MARARIAGAAIRRRREMQNDIGEADEPFETARLIEVGKNRRGALRAPEVGLIGIAHQDVESVATAQIGQRSACDVAAADNQEFFPV